VKRSYEEQVLLTDGTVVYARKDLVIQPNEFLMPGQGPVKKVRITFDLPDKNIVWNGTFPDSGKSSGRVFPITFDMLGSTPVVVVQVWNAACVRYGNPPEGLVAFAYKRDRWRRIPFNVIPSNWRVNLIGDISSRVINGGHTYTLDDKEMLLQKDETDYSKTRTIRQTIEWTRKVADTCGIREGKER
jgi:hypothetical protein